MIDKPEIIVESVDQGTIHKETAQQCMQTNPNDESQTQLPSNSQKVNTLSKAERTEYLRQEAFLLAYSQCGNIADSVSKAQASIYHYHHWLTDPDFADHHDLARKVYLSKLEREADRRAVEGWDEAVYQGGDLVGIKRKFSDTLLVFRMKRLDPEYRDRFEIEVKQKVDKQGLIDTLKVLKEHGFNPPNPVLEIEGMPVDA